MRRIELSMFLSAGLFVLATDGSAQQRAVQPPSDQLFAANAAMANMAEIQVGHLASEKAQNPAVKGFARQMVEDHIKAQNELADAAQGAGVQWPKSLDAKHAALKTRLSALSGVAFDREYMKAMVDGHREVEMALAARVGAPPSNGELAASVTEWSEKTLSAVRAHLKKAEEVSAELVKAGTR